VTVVAGESRRWRGTPVVLATLVAVALAVHLWGIRRNLPLLPEMDEGAFVLPALQIASTGDLNPHWFGHPGSTVIYPLAALIHLWNAVGHGGPLLHCDPGLRLRFLKGPAEGEAHLLGRLLSVSYAMLSLPLVYLLGRVTFGEPVGLLAVWFTLLSPLAIDHAQIVRTDAAGTFFAVLSLWLCCRLYDRPTLLNAQLAGLAIGLAMATRYFLVALVPVLLAAAAWRPKSPDGEARTSAVLVGLSAAFAGFVLSTPYFLLDRATVMSSLRDAAQSSHVGADGLSFGGNLAWYVTKAFPTAMTAPVAALALGGVVLVVVRRRPKELFLLGFAIAFLLGLSLSALHWERWIIPVVPVLALFAMALLVLVGAEVLGRVVTSRSRAPAIAVGVLALVSVRPVVDVWRYVRQSSGPSTIITARQWMLENLPAGAKISAEGYTPPLFGTPFVVDQARFTLAWGESLASYRQAGYRYLVVSSAVYGRFMAEAQRYRGEVGFYRDLFREGRLLKEFLPSATSRGPAIRVYELTAAG
jgi:4-amino-4-deoxy-L-arabinose transferase-like glycosyltransferase